MKECARTLGYYEDRDAAIQEVSSMGYIYMRLLYCWKHAFPAASHMIASLEHLSTHPASVREQAENILVYPVGYSIFIMCP